MSASENENVLISYHERAFKMLESVTGKNWIVRFHDRVGQSGCMTGIYTRWFLRCVENKGILEAWAVTVVHKAVAHLMSKWVEFHQRKMHYLLLLAASSFPGTRVPVGERCCERFLLWESGVACSPLSHATWTAMTPKKNQHKPRRLFFFSSGWKPSSNMSFYSSWPYHKKTAHWLLCHGYQWCRNH